MSEYGEALGLLEENFNQDVFAKKVVKEELEKREANWVIPWIAGSVGFVALLTFVATFLPIFGIEIASVETVGMNILLHAIMGVFSSLVLWHICAGLFIVGLTATGYLVPNNEDLEIETVPNNENKTIENGGTKNTNPYIDYFATPKLKSLIYKKTKMKKQEKLAYITSSTANGYTNIWLMAKFNEKILDGIKVKTVDLADTYAKTTAWKEAIETFEEKHLEEFNQQVNKILELEREKAYQQIAVSKDEKRLLKNEKKLLQQKDKIIENREQKELIEFKKRIDT